MTSKVWTHKDVNSEGKVKSGGSVVFKKGIYTSLSHGCKIDSCKCRKGFWLSINFGYNKKERQYPGLQFILKIRLTLMNSWLIKALR